MKTLISTSFIMACMGLSMCSYAENREGVLPKSDRADVKELGELVVGSEIEHKKFGIGKVIEIQLGEDATIINVQFSDHGNKWLIAEYADIKLIKDSSK